MLKGVISWLGKYDHVMTEAPKRIYLMGCSSCDRVGQGELKQVVKWHDRKRGIPYVIYQVYPDALEVMEGEYRLFYPSDRLLERSMFEAGQSDGEFYTYYESGALHSKGENCKGKMCGLRYEYYESGRMCMVVEYHDDRLWDIHEMYDSS